MSYTPEKPKPIEPKRELTSEERRTQRELKQIAEDQTHEMLADLGGTVPSEAEIPKEAIITHIDGHAQGPITDDLIKFDHLKTHINFKNKEGEKGGRQPHRGKTEVPMSDFDQSKLRLLQGKKIMLDVYGDEDSGRFEGEIEMVLPFAIKVDETGDVDAIKKTTHEKFDIEDKFKTFGDLAKYRNGDLIAVLGKEYNQKNNGQSKMEYTTEVNGELNEEKGIFYGQITYTIKFAHDTDAVNDAIKKLGNTFHAREEKAPTKSNSDTSPAKKPAPKESTEGLGSPRFLMEEATVTRDARGELVFTPIVMPPFFAAASWTAEFVKSANTPRHVTVLLKIKSGSTIYTYESAAEYSTITSSKQQSEFLLKR